MLKAGGYFLRNTFSEQSSKTALPVTDIGKLFTARRLSKELDSRRDFRNATNPWRRQALKEIFQD
jgi:hypothetical protein